MLWAALLLACAGVTSERRALAPVPREALRVTEGELAARGPAGEVLGPRLRAEAPGWSGERAVVVFTYLGPSDALVPLASGEGRSQVALKLRAQDACNLVYVGWRFAPTPGISVQVKRNAGQTRSADCGARGYLTVRGRRGAPLAAPAPGERHALRAEIGEGGVVRVHADGALVFEGVLPAEADGLRGPPGLRADNARMLVELRGDGAP
jgi:hypothetical protein